MNYYLMHKDDKVLSLDIHKPTGIILNYNVLMIEKKPECITNINSMNNWWSSRAIPKSRTDIKQILKRLNIQSTESLLLTCFGANLSDCFWVKPIGSNYTFKEINFYTNNFFRLPVENSEHRSPLGSSTGNMVKFWEIQDNKRILIKKNKDTVALRQCLNEVFAYNFHKKINKYNLCPYYLVFDKDNLIKGVACESFSNENTEYIPFADMLTVQEENQKSSRDIENSLITKLENLGIPRIKTEKYFSYLYITDFIISNFDRHLNNYGIMRDSNTLKIIDFAPIFDNGNSMLFENPKIIFNSNKFKFLSLKSTGLMKNDKKMIKLANKNWDMIDVSSLINFEDVNKFYSQYTDTATASFISKGYKYKIDILENLQKGYRVSEILYHKKQEVI